MAGEVCVEYTVTNKNELFCGNRIVVARDMRRETKYNEDGTATFEFIVIPWLFGRMDAFAYIKEVKRYLPHAEPQIVRQQRGQELAAQYMRWIMGKEEPPVYIAGTKNHRVLCAERDAHNKADAEKRAEELREQEKTLLSKEG